MIINENDLRGVDLNLLVTFSVLMRERHVTRSAQALHVSQAAVSAALGRLRKLFGDELFVRTSAGMVPTSKALEVAPRIGLALRELATVVGGDTGFVPEESDRTFTVAMSDDVEAYALPLILQRLQEQKLAISIIVRQSNSQVVESLMADGSADLALGAVPMLRGSYREEELFTSTYACLFDGRRLGINSPISMEDYLGMRHLLVSFDGRRGLVDDLLEARGLRRRVAGS